MTTLGSKAALSVIVAGLIATPAYAEELRFERNNTIIILNTDAIVVQDIEGVEQHDTIVYPTVSIRPGGERIESMNAAICGQVQGGERNLYMAMDLASTTYNADGSVKREWQAASPSWYTPYFDSIWSEVLDAACSAKGL